MHPLIIRRTYFGAYLAVWLLVAIMLAALLRVPGTLTWREALIVATPLCLFYAFVCLSPWYICRYLPLRSSNPLKLLLNHLGAALVASAIWVEMARLIAQFLDLGERIDPEVPHLVAVGLLLYSLSVALHYMLLAVEASREAELLARDAELRALKAQINPHFLFNSLNSITALTSVDPARAREMCICLSDFLRNTLGLGERASISWREELQLARTYLDVEQIRFGGRLRVEMNVDETCSECLVPPLVLQPLIENAVKHGIATLVEGGTITVEGHVNNGLLEVSVENGFDPESPSPRRHGLGLRNVRSRLETRFGGAARFAAHANNNHFRAEIVVPCQRAESAK
jgi:two-component system, LytTR family, sensor histidine kinase AlgZ